MASIDPKLPQSAIDADFIVQLKTTIVSALRGAIQDRNYPEKKIQGVNISIEYPMTIEKYPHIWVEFSFTKFQQAGIGHFLQDEGGDIQGEWMFDGAARFTIMALSSLERDVYSSQFLHLFAFSKFHPVAKKFDDILMAGDAYSLSVDRDTLTPGGQTASVGVPWSPETIAYQDVYSIRMMGHTQSTFKMETLSLREIDVATSGIINGVVDPLLNYQMP